SQGIDCQRFLVTVDGEPAFLAGLQDSGDVEQHVDRFAAGNFRRGQGAHLVEGGKVRPAGLESSARILSPYRCDGVFGGGPRPRGEQNTMSSRGEPVGGGAPESASSPSEQ